ncbi:M23 family metallopeptidase [Paenibacillus sp. 1011MAR3C5]|uniref:M23 family metallopeptidase n=1 Tax=Paenibacillus sp. 1011MAR3C5 TaxID=1675787 RepID=UPI000E6CAFCF|nr:M23 family metallopeptidase [Paenibacillus sp. 1011MAR3C5]RJE91041.1 M23 family metallopeptidase [Paenibacillus sp. 1011MAR3C5]
MGLRDDVKQRRHEKIRSLLHHYNESSDNGPNRQASEWSSDSGSNMNAVAPLQEELVPKSSVDKSMRSPAGASVSDKGKTRSLDPELAWKQNPNPWAAWDEERQPGRARSYVKSQHTDDFDPPGTSGWKRFRNELAWKFAISVALFGGIWAMFEAEYPWTAKGQAFVTESMSSEIDFESVAAWYKDVFAGAPSFIPIFGGNGGQATLVDGQPKQPVVSPLENATVVRTFADLLNGVELAGDPEAAVAAVETGRVIQVSPQGDSVLIQHANERTTIYGKLAAVNVAVNDWVEAGQTIGKLQPAGHDGHSFLYIAVKQKDRYMDPLDVIPID